VSDQLTLDYGSSRWSDPATSVAAGQSVADNVLRDQQALVLHVLDVFARHGDDATAYELWRFLTEQGNRIKENVVAKRLTELRAKGWVRLTDETRPGSSHRHQQVHAITDAGRERWRVWHDTAGAA
jgi:DNA-binding PadR family transcriptional regulator